MIRTTVSMVGTTLAKHLYLIIVIFHVKMPTVLEFESKRTRCPLFMKFGVGPGLENLPNGNCELQSWDTFELWATRIGLKIFIYRDIISEI